MKDIVILFGAGASFGAGDIIPERPPLGFQLYKRLAEIYPNSWGAFPNIIKEKFLENFEIGMGIIYENYSQSIAELMQQMGIYFIQFRPYSGSSLYCRLIQDFQQNGCIEATLFSTLNYDCVLEFSLLNHGLSITYFDEGEKTGAIPVWKLHGSCNMFSKDIQLSQSVQFSRDVSFGGGIEAFLDIGTVVEKCLVNTGLPPAMCLYMKGKPLQISPSIIKDLQNSWECLIENCKVAVCIGVNPLPEDTHIWQSLSSTKAHLYFIGDESAFSKWIHDYRVGPSEFLGAYFHTGYPKLKRRLIDHVSHW